MKSKPRKISGRPMEQIFLIYWNCCCKWDWMEIPLSLFFSFGLPITSPLAGIPHQCKSTQCNGHICTFPHLSVLFESGTQLCIAGYSSSKGNMPAPPKKWKLNFFRSLFFEPFKTVWWNAILMMFSVYFMVKIIITR